MKRIYEYREFPLKIKLLTVYYRYHLNIPRLFMLPISKFFE